MLDLLRVVNHCTPYVVSDDLKHKMSLRRVNEMERTKRSSKNEFILEVQVLSIFKVMIISFEL